MRILGVAFMALVVVGPGCAIVASEDGATGKHKAKLDERPEVFPNSIKYRDAGLKPATGRSGSAQVTARALLTKDGKTDLEITTGELDSTNVPVGRLARTQVKVLDKNGEAVLTRNDAPTTGGYVKYTYDTFVRGQPLRVQANVTGIDASRTDVVTVTETVKRRPDLSITRVDAPARAPLDADVAIVGTLRELNADVGARGICVLRVDGEVVDWIRDVWVDAGGTVGCAFAHTFGKPGKHAIEVAVLPASVVPADYDTLNNAVGTSIAIDEPKPPSEEVVHLDGYGSIVSYDQLKTSQVQDFWYASPVDGAPDGHYESSLSGTQQFASLQAWGYRKLKFPVSLSFEDSSDGVPLHSERFDFSADTFENIPGGKGAYRAERTCGHAYRGGATYDVCVHETFASDGTSLKVETSFRRFHVSMEATYYSKYYGSIYGNPWGTFEGTYTIRSGPISTYGSNYGLDVRLSDGAVTLASASSGPMFPVKWSSVYPYTCELDRYWWFGYVGKYCSSSSYVVEGRVGNVGFWK